MSDPDVLTMALQRYGASRNLRMLQELCGELVAAIGRYETGHASQVELAEKLADVLIMGATARRILGPELVDKAVARKMVRLAERVMQGD